MSQEITNAFVQNYQDTVVHLAQQKGSRLLETVMRKDIKGKNTHFDRIGKVSARKKTTRHATVTYQDTPHSRRLVTPEDYYAVDLIDDEDEVRLLIDPSSHYAMAQANALGRQLDEIITAAAVGNAVAKTADENSEATSNVAVAHTVDEDFNTANSDIIIEKVIEAKRILASNDVDDSEDFYFVLDSTALHNLIQEQEVASFDYNTLRSIMAGKIETVMGFKFIRSELLTDSSESFKQCLAYTGTALGLAMNRDINTAMDRIPERFNALQVLTTMTAGAVRVEEEKLVVVEAYRT